MAVIYLVRHGQASWGKSDYDQLSSTGIAQSKHLGGILMKRIGRPDLVIAGAMQRHKQTAEHVLTHMGISAKWRTDPGWNEYDHQELIVRMNPKYKSRAYMLMDLARTLKPKETFQSFFEQALDRWVSGVHDDEYRESWPMFRQRVDESLNSILNQPAESTLVFTSGGAISATVKRLWNMPDSEWRKLNRVVTNASLTKIVVGRRGMHLSTFNDHGHFEGEHSRLLTYR